MLLKIHMMFQVSAHGLLKWIQSYKGVPILGLKWPIYPKLEFFLKKTIYIIFISLLLTLINFSCASWPLVGCHWLGKFSKICPPHSPKSWGHNFLWGETSGGQHGTVGHRGWHHVMGMLWYAKTLES